MMSQQIVVLGMHASGTSLTAHLIKEMGVHIGDTFMGPMKGKPTWEDKQIVLLNAAILNRAGGNWENVPEHDRIVGLQFDDEISGKIKGLVDNREAQHALWGWKDPRSALTIELYMPYLSNPKYVYVKRDPAAVAQSILARGLSGHDFEGWVRIAYEYNRRIDLFLQSTDAPRLQLFYEDLMKRGQSLAEVCRLAWFVGADGDQAERAMGVIRFK